MAIPGTDRPGRVGRRVRVLREPEQDQVIDEQGERGCSLDRPRRLALRLGEAQELLRIMEGDLSPPTTIPLKQLL